jgi:hypothetical protein
MGLKTGWLTETDQDTKLSLYRHFRTYEALIGVVTHDYFNDLSDEDLTSGISQQQRDRMLQTFVRNHYNAHLQVTMSRLLFSYSMMLTISKRGPDLDKISWCHDIQQ